MKLRSMRGLLVVALATAVFCILPLLGKAAAKETIESQRHPAPSAAVPVAIPMAEIASRATEVSNFLRTLSSQVLAPSPEVEKIWHQLPKVSDQIVLELAAVARVLEGPASFETLQTQEQLWKRLQLQMSGWLTQLTARATHLQEALDRVASLHETWTRTRDAAVAANVPGPILEGIEETLADLDAAQPGLKARHGAVLDLQSRIAQEMARCGKALSDIAQAQQRAMGGILARDGLPIWSAKLWDTPFASFLDRIHRTASVFMADIHQYFFPASAGLYVLVGLFVALAILFSAARRRVIHWVAAGEGRSPYTGVFDHPYAAALLVPLLVGAGPLWQAPTIIRQIFNVLALVPMVRLTRQSVQPNLIRGVYALGILFAVDTVRQALAGAPLLEQGLLLLEALSGMVLVRWSLAHGHLRRLHEQGNGTVRPQVLRAAGWLVLLSLAGGLVGGVFGYLRLARLLVSGLLAGGTLALGAYCSLRLLSGLVAFSLRLWPLRRLRMVQHHRGYLEHRTHRFLVWVLSVGWVVRSLDYVGLLDPALSLLRAFLSARLEQGSLSISLGDVLAFVLTVWASYIISTIIRFVLHEDIYPRTQIASGLSYAISNLLHYLILTVGFVMGLAALGMDLTKLTVLAGAFGVGIGFGLQSVVHNFVSGLILLFERPIHVGDTIEVGNLMGEVRQIGIRASKLRTRQGADMFVPNSQLTSERLTNWTLSDRMRRIDLPVGVNYGAKPKNVIAVMEQVALAHPRVLRHPPPQALLTGYGDSSINFELRAWTDQFDDWATIRSDLAVALYDGIQEAGMQFPFPQREVRLLHDSHDSVTNYRSTQVSVRTQESEVRIQNSVDRKED
jgi:potassium-dependent mechanosensitive channel